MNFLIQPIPIAGLSPRNDLALEEVLDALDPLRHYFQSSIETHSPNSEDTLVPLQPSLTVGRIKEFSFGATMPNTHEFFPSPISISLAVDASPGCGGVAWPAGQVLAEYIARLGPEYVKGRTILELGSGTGLVGLVSGALGAEAVWITDQAFVSHSQTSFSVGEIMTSTTPYDM